MAEDLGPAAGRIRLKITCPTHLVADLEVDSVRLPGVLGNRLVLPHQAPYFMRLTAGPAILHRAGQNDVVYLLSAGVCEVRRDICAVMAWAIRPEDVDPAVIQASEDLGASRWQTFTYVLWPLSRPGVESGVQAIFIPSLSLFMLTRLIGGNRVITLGTAIEEYFMTTMNWNMGATIGVILIVLMVIAMLITSRKARRRKVDL